MTGARIGSDRAREASLVRPSERQLRWQQREFTAFLHFGMNTMTDREWGVGHESPASFDPADVDVDQWMTAIASGGMHGVILTTKHHDGFCLWPSRHSAHTVAASPWRDGGGDLVRETAEAAARHGLAFGVYLSPWDRTEATYGTGAAYDDFFVAQLTELLTQYGPISTVWLDGANGEGADGLVQYYDWNRYYEVVRRLQPDAVISVCGPDVRWCGNEAGHTRADEWSVVPSSLRDAERIASRSQQNDDGGFSRLVRSDEEDLGSLAVLAQSQDDLVWYPAEVNTSIRPGWFHHPGEDDAVRSSAELFEIYRRSVGGNGGFLLNVPPARDGRIADPDLRALRELGALIDELAQRDIATSRQEWVGGPASPPSIESPWQPCVGDSLRVEWALPVTLDGLVLAEDIAFGQQIDELAVEIESAEGGAAEVFVVRSVGYRRIVDLPRQSSRAVVVRLQKARGPVRVSKLAVLRPSDLLPGGGSAGR